ncbi:hypothetical protein Tco_0866705 [Tanacetum coccineum]
MSTQQDIYAAGSENRPPMLNKENYVPWSSRLLRYAKSRPNGKLIYNSIMNGPYVRRMIPEPDDQAIQTILLGLPEDIYAAVDSCETAQEIWLRVQQMMKGSDIGIQEKKAKLFNEWERFTSTDGESIESYYHRFSKLMNDFKRNKHFPEKIASNLKFLNNLQPEWSRHVTIVHQTKDLHTTDYTQLYDFLKYNQKEVDDQRAERLAKTHDPLALMANSNNPFNYPVFHQDQPSPSTYMQQPQPINNNYNPQPSFNQNYMQQPMPNPEDITDPTTAMNMALVLMAKAFKLNYSTPTNNNQRISSNLVTADCSTYAGQKLVSQCITAEVMRLVNNGNQNNVLQLQMLGYLARNCTSYQGEGMLLYLRLQFVDCSKGRSRNQLQRRFDLMAAAADLDEIEEVNANCILMANLQQASTSGTQTDNAPVYDSDGSAEVHNYDNCYDNEIFNMFTQEEQYTELLEPIPEPHQVQQNDSNVISEISCVEQEGGTVDQYPETVEETRAYFESLYNNLALEVEKVNSVNRKLKETNADLTTELARYKNQEKCFEISQEKYDKLERCTKMKNANMTKISYDKADNDMQQKLEAVASSDGRTKGKSTELHVYRNTLDPLSQKLENKNVELEFQVRNYEKEIAHLKTTDKNLFDSISVNTPVIDESSDKWTPPKECLGLILSSLLGKKSMSLTKLEQAFRDNSNHRFHNTFDTKKDVNSDSNGSSSTGVDNTAKTKRPQPRSNTKNNRVPSASKSSCIKNKEVEEKNTIGIYCFLRIRNICHLNCKLPIV